MDKDFKKQEKRIESIFPKDLDDNSKRGETFEIYLAYLKNNLTFPIKLTGHEGFDWEEFYLFGPGDDNEYEKLKETRPSYRDTFNLIRVEDDYEDNYGLLAKVTRVSDKKRFKIPLSVLKVINKKSTNYQIVDDYATWVENY